MYKLYKGVCYYVVVGDNFIAYDNGNWKNMMKDVDCWRTWLAGELLSGIKEVNELELLVATGISRGELTDIISGLRTDDIQHRNTQSSI